MAYMIPAQVSQLTESNAEKSLFRRFKDDLPDQDWTVLHSLGLTTHKRKPWAEIDFVLIGPPGVYCIEVKGGTIGRSNGVWTTTTQSGKCNELKESPFAQVGSAAAALHGFLVGAVASMRESVTGYGVMFPEVRFRVPGPDIELDVLYDADDGSNPLVHYIERLTGYWDERCRRDWGRTPKPLDERARRAVRDAISRDFDLCASLRAQLGAVGDQLVRLTEEQSRTFEGLTENPRVLVSGGAGTGKTLLAVSEARRLAASGNRVLLLCFNRKLSEHLRCQFSQESRVTVQHLHGFMASVIRDAGLQSKLPDAEATDLFEVFYPDLAVEALLTRDELRFDAMVIDEGQDILLDRYLDVMDAALLGELKAGMWRIFFDPNQNIYDGTARGGSERLRSFQPACYRLTMNCRNTMAIAIGTALLSGIPADPVLKAEGPEVVYTWYADREGQRRAVSDRVRKLLYQGLRPQEITVLSPVRLSNSCLATGLISCPCAIAEPASDASTDSRSVCFSTISGFKGLEADTVLLIDIDKLDTSVNADLYVGASRARALLHVFLNASQRDAYAKLAFRFGEMSAVSGCPKED